jgi:hypothetical protein
MIVRSPRVRPGKFVFGEAKRVLQHYPSMNGHIQLDPSRLKSAISGT